MKPLDTSVKGSPGTLGASADFLDKYAKALEADGDKHTKVDNLRQSAWEGPASDECGDALADVSVDDIDQVADQTRNVARAERTLQHEINAVARKMHHAIHVAHRGQLDFNGPLILPPTPPGPAPKPPSTKLPTDKAFAAGHAYRDELQSHQMACAEYNSKLAAYKQADAIIKQARDQEQNAYKEFEQTIASAYKTVSDLATCGKRAVLWAASYVKTAHGLAEEMFEKSNDTIEVGKIYQNFNSGGLLKMTPEYEQVIEWGKTHAQELSDYYEKKGKQAQKFYNKVPRWVTKGVSADPSNFVKDTKSFIQGPVGEGVLM